MTRQTIRTQTQFLRRKTTLRRALPDPGGQNPEKGSEHSLTQPHLSVLFRIRGALKTTADVSISSPAKDTASDADRKTSTSASKGAKHLLNCANADSKTNCLTSTLGPKDKVRQSESKAAGEVRQFGQASKAPSIHCVQGSEESSSRCP